MRIHILYEFTNVPWGGGNQFLKALKKELTSKGFYEQDVARADVVLYNSHHGFKRVLDLKLKYPEKIFIHRLGPVFHYHRGRSWKRHDETILQLTNTISDGVIFQSQWSLKEGIALGFHAYIPHRIVINAVDESLFHQHDKTLFSDKRKIRLISTSFSLGKTKGFDVYEYLDQHLDFTKYEMTFMGNSPVPFRSIQQVKPGDSAMVAKMLKQYDIYITASTNDACSNALLEALACGLPVVACNSGGHPELVRRGGELFHRREEVIGKIEQVVQNYEIYQRNIRVQSMKEVAKDYMRFARELCMIKGRGDSKPKRVTRMQYYVLLCRYLFANRILKKLML